METNKFVPQDACWKETSRRLWICWRAGQNFNHTIAGHSPETKELFARFKSRQETLFRGYKALGIMGGGPFRHKGKQGGGSAERLAVHKLVFRAVTVVMQYNLENVPLFDI